MSGKFEGMTDITEVLEFVTDTMLTDPTAANDEEFSSSASEDESTLDSTSSHPLRKVLQKGMQNVVAYIHNQMISRTDEQRHRFGLG